MVILSNEEVQAYSKDKELPICSACAHFDKSGVFYKCRLFYTVNIVHGKRNYFLCTDARDDDSLCGLKGVRYEKRRPGPIQSAGILLACGAGIASLIGMFIWFLE